MSKYEDYEEGYEENHDMARDPEEVLRRLGPGHSGDILEAIWKLYRDEFEVWFDDVIGHIDSITDKHGYVFLPEPSDKTTFAAEQLSERPYKTIEEVFDVESVLDAIEENKKDDLSGWLEDNHEPLGYLSKDDAPTIETYAEVLADMSPRELLDFSTDLCVRQQRTAEELLRALATDIGYGV